MENMQNQRGRDVSAPVTHITIDGRRYALAFNNRSARIAEDIYEQVYGKDVGYAEILAALAKFKYKAVMAMFYGAMVAGGAEIDWETFDEKFKLDSIDGIREIIAKGVIDALPKDNEGSEAEDKNP